MPDEIERKFLVVSDAWGPADDGTRQRQGYLSITDRGTVRVRVEGDRAEMNLKSAQTGLTQSPAAAPNSHVIRADTKG